MESVCWMQFAKGKSLHWISKRLLMESSQRRFVYYGDEIHFIYQNLNSVDVDGRRLSMISLGKPISLICYDNLVVPNSPAGFVSQAMLRKKKEPSTSVIAGDVCCAVTSAAVDRTLL